MKNIAIILAAGSGTRVGGDIPKQFRKLADGRTVLDTCIDAFRACPLIDEVMVVLPPCYKGGCREDAERIDGGKERWESSWNAIQWVESKLKNEDAATLCTDGECENVNLLIHDAARPFVSQRIITDVCQALETHEAVTVAVPATDTMYECEMLAPQSSMSNSKLKTQNSNFKIRSIPPRSTMFRAQTPQAFRLSVIKRAYELAMQDPNLQATDDCGIVHKYLPSVPVYIVEGEETNRKITFKEDLQQ